MPTSLYIPTENKLKRKPNQAKTKPKKPKTQTTQADQMFLFSIFLTQKFCCFFFSVAQRTGRQDSFATS